MAISDKVTSITNHLIADWEAIENLGGSAEDKNIENIATSLNDIYNNIPKTTDTGTNLSLSTIKGKMSTQIKGDTQQDTTQGYNLLEPSFESTSSNNVTITNNGNGTFALSGTASADAVFVFKRNWSLSSNTEYRVSGCPSGRKFVKILYLWCGCCCNDK